jgi:hypothetical protein
VGVHVKKGFEQPVVEDLGDEKAENKKYERNDC